MLDLFDFLSRSIGVRAMALWKHGVFLADIAYDQEHSAFYAYRDYYVEVVSEKGGDRLIEIVPFEAGERFERLKLLLKQGHPPLGQVG